MLLKNDILKQIAFLRAEITQIGLAISKSEEKLKSIEIKFLPYNQL